MWRDTFLWIVCCCLFADGLGLLDMQIKDEVVPVHGLKVNRESTGIAVLILKLGAWCRWVANNMLWSVYALEKDFSTQWIVRLQSWCEHFAEE